MRAATIFSLAILLSATCAQAHTIGYRDNQVGGDIVLIDIRGNCPKDSYVAYSTTETGADAQTGCWMYLEPSVVVNWDNGLQRIYSASSFIASSWAKKGAKK